MEKEIKEINQKLQKNKMVTRALFMIFFIIVYSVSKFLIIGLALFQFITLLMIDKPNEQMLRFAQSLSIFIYQIIRFVSFNTEVKPFPFSEWPNDKDKPYNDKEIDSDSDSSKSD